MGRDRQHLRSRVRETPYLRRARNDRRLAMVENSVNIEKSSNKTKTLKFINENGGYCCDKC